MSILDLIPGGRVVQMLVLVAFAAAVIGGITWAVHSYNEGLREEGRAEVQAKWNKETKDQVTAAFVEAEANAKESKRRLERQGEAQHENQTELARYQHVAADAVAARAGMQLDIDNLAAVARRATSDSATAGEREAGSAAAGVLADVSRRSDGLAEIYARTADAARRAGILCERSYDALTVKP